MSSLFLGVLLVTVNDSPRMTDMSKAAVEMMIGRSFEYIARQAGGRADTDAKVYDWISLPLGSAEWNALGTVAGQRVIDVVSPQLGINLATYYDHLVLIVDKADSTGGVTSPDGRFLYMAAKDVEPTLFCRLIGHLLGAGPANRDDFGGPVEFGGRYCLMGGEASKLSFVDQWADGRPGARSGPGMSAPALVAVGWLDLENPTHAVDITSELASGQPFEIRMNSLDGAPRSDYTWIPSVAFAKRADGQMLMIERRTPFEWDRGLPTGETTWTPPDGPPFDRVVFHLAKGSTSLQIGDFQATEGASADFSGVRVEVVRDPNTSWLTNLRIRSV